MLHAVKLYMGGVALGEGSITEVNVTPGTELQAVTTALIDPALDLLVKSCKRFARAMALLELVELDGVEMLAIAIVEQHREHPSDHQCSRYCQAFVDEVILSIRGPLRFLSSSWWVYVDSAHSRHARMWLL